MSKSQQYLRALLESVPLHELESPDQRTLFDNIRTKISSAADVAGELKNLYRVKGFSDFALNLLWISQKVERNPSLLGPTEEEQAIVVREFLNATRPSVGADASVTETETAASVWETTGVPSSETAAMASSGPASDRAGGGGEGFEQEFASQIERFVEAMQSGADDRLEQMERILERCREGSAEEADVAEDYRKFCTTMIEFITYVNENQLLDDIRAMNLLSNVPDPVWEWARADQANRTGMLDAATEVLRDFKSLFE